MLAFAVLAPGGVLEATARARRGAPGLAFTGADRARVTKADLVSVLIESTDAEKVLGRSPFKHAMSRVEKLSGEIISAQLGLDSVQKLIKLPQVNLVQSQEAEPVSPNGGPPERRRDSNGGRAPPSIRDRQGRADRGDRLGVRPDAPDVPGLSPRDRGWRGCWCKRPTALRKSSRRRSWRRR